MERFSILLSSLSALAIILTILFEGQLKIRENKRKDIGYKKFFNLSVYGWILILISLFASIGNGYISYRNIIDNDKQYKEAKAKNDLLLKSSYDVIEHLKEKNTKDSIRLAHLDSLTIENGLKSDSIKRSVVDSAVKTLEEQRQTVERERENIFIHFQKEVKANLFILLNDFESNNIKALKDSTIFPISRLSDIYIKKYGLMSNNKIIVEFLEDASEMINKSNYFANELMSVEDLKMRDLGVASFLKVNDVVYNILGNIYNRISNLKSYKEYAIKCKF